MTLRVRLLLTSIPEKYLGTKAGLMAIRTVKIPIGSFWKSMRTEKLYDVVGMYEARIDTAEESPLMILTLSTSLQLLRQSLEDWMSAIGR